VQLVGVPVQRSLADRSDEASHNFIVDLAGLDPVGARIFVTGTWSVIVVSLGTFLMWVLL
jgi:hypothetical protein